MEYAPEIVSPDTTVSAAIAHIIIGTIGHFGGGYVPMKERIVHFGPESEAINGKVRPIDERRQMTGKTISINEE